jgi:hypothetical protein
MLTNGNENAYLTTYGDSAYSRHVETHDNLADAGTDQAPTDRCQAQGSESGATDSTLRGRWIEQGEALGTRTKAGLPTVSAADKP